MFQAEDHQHQRFNPLRSEWVLVCPHRTKRPWKGKNEDAHGDGFVSGNLNNSLCPGSVRASGKVNDMYSSTFVFDNDFPALSPDTPDVPECAHPLLQQRSARGTCRVMCFHPKSSVTLPLMSVAEIQNVILEWIHQFKDLSSQYVWVQIFENKGEIMGCSNPHPHCQIWASSYIPEEGRKEDENQLEYFNANDRLLLMDYVDLELEKKVRIVVQNSSWLVVVPFWAVWPYELLLLPKRVVHRLDELNELQQLELAEIMKNFLTKYDNLFKCSFPYSMGWHGAPSGCKYAESCSHWLLHAHFYPPLLRSASIKKFLVGYEMLAQPQRDLTAEKAAATLRELSSVHFKQSDQE